ncbi:MAG: flippase-like domain-containing protein [Firmicutes bacterium]|nr:flippase-like domain-containing protein [Bacillota bacterium]
MQSSFESKQNKRRNVIWALAFVIIAAASVYAVKKVSGNFSLTRILELLSNAAPVPIILAFAALAGFFVCGAMALKVLLKSFGQKCSLKQSIVFVSADLYFSAITPSSTGGQPACGYFMAKSGIPASCVTVCLVFNIAMYTLSIIVIGLAAIFIAPGVFYYFSTAARILILLGSIGLAILALIGIAVTIRRSVIDRIASIVIRVGKKLRFIKDRSDEVSIIQWVEDYKSYADQLKGHGPALIKSLVFNILSRLCQLSITMFMYIAITLGGPANAWQVIKQGAMLMGAQSLISIGSTFVPIPGAMGYTDLMMLNAFGKVMSDADASSLEFMSRSVSFYLCVLIAFVIVVVYTLCRKKKR